MITEITDIKSAVRLCAIAGAVKDKLAKEAKAKIPAGSAHPVDVTVRVRGSVIKGADQPAAGGTQPPNVSLFERTVLLELISHLKVSPQRAETVLRDIVKKVTDAAQLGELGQGEKAQAIAAVIESVQGELHGRLPAETWSRPGRAGPVQTDVTVELIKSEKTPCQAAA